MNIPSKITAGDFVVWDDSPSSDNLGNQIFAPDWVLKYDLRQSGITNLTLTAAQNGSGWRTALPAASSATYGPGKVFWQAWASKGSERVTLGSGYINMQKNLAAAANTEEFRTPSEVDLAAVQTAIRNMINGGAVQEYSINGRSLRKIDLSELRAMEASLKAVVARENAANNINNGRGNPRNAVVRFKG